MEVGPLARLLVAYASGRTDVQELVKDTLGKLNVPVARCSPRWAAPRRAAWMRRWP
jgi:Ni,Fe-hydrogenase I large subunit